MTGRLYLVPTPLGNLEDITLRAVRILREVELVFAEDTRRTRTLLDHYQITTPLASLHEHNEQQKSQSIIEQLLEGKRFALCSDAGTPLISDPGAALTRAAIQAGVYVEPLPGPCAAISALCASGLSTETFRFCGFLPRGSDRKKLLASLKDETATLIFYESPHRLKEALEDLQKVFGARPVCVAREMTKLHEEFLRGTPEEILATLPEEVLGEISLIVEGAPPKEEIPQDEATLRLVLKAAINAGASTKDAAQIAASLTGVSKKAAYSIALTLPQE